MLALLSQGYSLSTLSLVPAPNMELRGIYQQSCTKHEKCKVKMLHLLCRLGRKWYFLRLWAEEGLSQWRPETCACVRSWS